MSKIRDNARFAIRYWRKILVKKNWELKKKILKTAFIALLFAIGVFVALADKIFYPLLKPQVSSLIRIICGNITWKNEHIIYLKCLSILTVILTFTIVILIACMRKTRRKYDLDSAALNLAMPMFVMSLPFVFGYSYYSYIPVAIIMIIVLVLATWIKRNWNTFNLDIDTPKLVNIIFFSIVTFAIFCNLMINNALLAIALAYGMIAISIIISVFYLDLDEITVSMYKRILVGGIIGAFFGFLLEKSSGIINMVICGITWGIIAGVLSGSPGTILSVVFPIILIIDPLAALFLFLFSIVVLLSASNIDDFWYDIIKSYFRKRTILSKNILEMALGRNLSIDDAYYFHILLNKAGLGVIAKIRCGNYEFQITDPNKYETYIAKAGVKSWLNALKMCSIESFEAFPVSFDHYFEKISQGSYLVMGSIEAISKILKVKSWVLDISQRVSEEYVIVDGILYYVPKSELKKLWEESLKMLSERWKISERTLVKIRDAFRKKLMTKANS